MKPLLGLPKPLLLATVLAALSAISTFGQASPGPGPVKSTTIYDPKTETTVTGVIQEVKEVPGAGRSTGTHLVVKAGEEVDDIHVGPTWYLKQQNYEFAKGDQIEVIGSKVKYQGADVIVARQIKKGGSSWTLRNARGIPVWSRGRNR
ncbi:MAG: hypothetical protein WBR10_21110 [Candidatus Acidiferrum sp.]